MAGEDGFEVYEGEGEGRLVEDLETWLSRRELESEIWRARGMDNHGLDELVGLRGRGRSGSGRLSVLTAWRGRNLEVRRWTCIR